MEDHIREEVLYREPEALGLDRDDTIVRRKMAQKMDFLTQDIATAIEPDDAALRAFFDLNAARYNKAARVSFKHVYFSQDRRGPQLDADALAALGSLREGGNEEQLGDPFLGVHELPRPTRRRSQRRLVRNLQLPSLQCRLANGAGRQVELWPSSGVGGRTRGAAARGVRIRPRGRAPNILRRHNCSPTCLD